MCDGHVMDWLKGEWLGLPVHELHAHKPDAVLTDFEVLLQESDGIYWRYRRDQSIGVPLGNAIMHNRDGVPFLRPDLVLLHKSKHCRDKDQADFDACLPLLNEHQKRWLKTALVNCQPNHVWIAALS